MENNFIETLRESGLSETEAILYTTLLKFSKMTLSELSRVSSIKRATCYQYIESLLAKDFIVRVPIKKRIFYSAANPKKILASARKRHSKLESSLQEMEQQHDRSTNKPKILFYEGKREIKKVYEDMFTTIGNAYSLFPPEAFFENFTADEYAAFDASINEHAFKSKDLIIEDKYFRRIQELRKHNSSTEQLMKKLPKSFSSSVDMLVCGNKVALVSLCDLSAVVIENKHIAELFKSMHTFIWKSAERA